MNSIHKYLKKTFILTFALLIVGTFLTLFVPVPPTSASSTCLKDAVSVIWARGSGQEFDGPEAVAFKTYVAEALANQNLNYTWSEVGNFDFDNNVESGEYGAVGPLPGYVWGGLFMNGYGNAVYDGTNELVNQLNLQASTCPEQAFVVGGYSQGADVVGWALERTSGISLLARAKSRIAFVALYGDPKNKGNLGTDNACESFPWVRGDSPCEDTIVEGVLSPRNPYVPAGWENRVGSWCANGDHVCNAPAVFLGWGTHTSTYRNSMIAESAHEIAKNAKYKICALNSADTPGIVRAVGDHWEWHLRNCSSGGSAEVVFDYGLTATDTPIVGDWNNDGIFTAGIVRKNGAGWEWHLRNSNTGGTASVTPFIYGLTATDTPVVGDWDGVNGTTIGIVRKNGAGLEWHLRNSNNGGSAVPFIYGKSSDKPVVGDWDHNGTTTVGIVRNDGAGHWQWHMRNSNNGGAANISFVYGLTSDKPIVGDWDKDGDTNTGVTRSDGAGGLRWLLNTSSSSGGSAYFDFIYGNLSDRPVAGDWDGLH